MIPSLPVHGPVVVSSKYLTKKINDIKDVAYFKTNTPAYRNIVAFVDAMCSLIYGQGKNFSPSKHEIKDSHIEKCAKLLDTLSVRCQETDLKDGHSAGCTRFGLAAFRDWFDEMKSFVEDFIKKELIPSEMIQLKEELSHYLTDSFGNRMRIDYGTGHELNFIIFMMGICGIITKTIDGDDVRDISLTPEKILDFVKVHGHDLHSLFLAKYIPLCRKVQSRFRLEPAGSRGVYNMDDYQFLPFLFGAAQLSNTRGISVKEFYDPDIVDMFRNDYIFFESIDFILNNKRGPFNEHSYTLWNYSGLASWADIYRRMRTKYNDEVLSPFPIVQHLLFGRYILRWGDESEE